MRDDWMELFTWLVFGVSTGSGYYLDSVIVMNLMVSFTWVHE
jgi:hypothetical protein